MNKIKKTLIIAGIFLAVGVTGSVITGVKMVPEVVNEVYRVKREVVNANPAEKEMFVTAEVVENLDISALKNEGFNVEIRSSSDSNARVKVYEYLENEMEIESEYNSETKTLSVKASRDVFDFFKENSIKGLFEHGYNNMIYSLAGERNDTNPLVIEVPAGANIVFKGEQYNNLIVRDVEVLKDRLIYDGNGGDVDLPVNNTLKTIDIRTNNNLRMDLREFINAETVDIRANNVYIVSEGYSIDYSTVNKFPQNVTLKGNYVDIESYLPLGSDVVIDSQSVEYNGNFQLYPLDVRLSGSQGASAFFHGDDLKANYNEDITLGNNYTGVLGIEDSSNYHLTIKGFNHCEINHNSERDLEDNLR